MTSKGRLFAKALIESPTMTNILSSVTDGSGTQIFSTITVATPNDLPLNGNNAGDQAFVSATNRLYLWNGTGWYNIALINTNPSITGGYNSSYYFATDGTPIEITLVGSDPEGIPLTWSYEVTTGSLTNGGGTTATVSNIDNVFTVTPTTNEAYAGTFSITWKASDGVNLGTAVSSFTLAFTVADSKYTSLLVKALASGANATFVDSSANNFTITKNGDVTQGAFSPFSQPEGAWSNYFDGSGDVLTFPNSSELAFGTGAFTIDWWVNAPTTQDMFFIGGRAASGGNFHLTSGGYSGLTPVGSLRFGVDETASTTIVCDNTWHHCAVTRDASNNLKIYVDGVLEATTTYSSDMATTTGTWYIGKNDLSDGSYLNGYISNLRFIKGTAIDFATEGAPTSPTDTTVTGTGLLTCQSNRFVDNSTNGFALTPTGNVAVSPFSPFDRLAYDPAVHGGGAYFDGSGDYLSSANDASFNLEGNDFTIECFIYRTTNTSGVILSKKTVGSPSWVELDLANTTNYLRILLSNSVGSWTTTLDSGINPGINSWHHVAAVRNGDTINLYLDGVNIASTTHTGTISTDADNVQIGASDQGTVTNPFNGHISNLRVVNGTAVYTSAFTPPTAPLTAVTNTSLLLNCTNADIIDNDSKNNLKLVGNTAASSTQTKYAARSVYLDGAGDYITLDNFDLFDFRSADFTVECWVKTTDTDSVIVSCASSGGATNTNWGMYIISSTASFYASDGSTYQISALGGSTAVNDGSWHHVAATRNGSNFRFFVDGTQVGSTATWSGAISSTSRLLRIGDNGTGSAATYYAGYIEDLRITKGLARYTANFTPPTAELLG